MATEYRPIPRLAVGVYPLTNVTPFTYRDGVTYERLLHQLIDRMNTIIGEVNTNNQALFDVVIENMNITIDAVNAALGEQTDEVDQKIIALTEYVNVEVQKVVDMRDDMEDFRDETETFRNQAETFSATTEALQDAAVAQLITTPGSETQTQLNATIAEANAFRVSAASYGVKADNTTDDAASLWAAVDAALEAVADGGDTYRTAIVELPPGVIRVGSGKVIDLIPTSPNTDTRKRLVIRGAGALSTVIKTTSEFTSGTLLDVSGGSVQLEDLTFHGNRTFSGTLLSLGGTTPQSYVNQSSFARVSFWAGGDGATMLRAVWLFDSSFTDVQFMRIGDNAVGLDIPAHPNDHVNNLAFTRCHWESNGAGVTLMRIRGGGYHHVSMSFDQCHWESRSYAVRPIDIDGASRLTFTASHIVQQNTDGASEGVTSADAVPLMRLVNIIGMSFLSGGVSRPPTETSWPNKIISVGGQTRGVSFISAWFRRGMSASQAWVDSIVEEDATVPLTENNGVGGIQFHNSGIDNYELTELSPSQNVLQDSGSRNAWSVRFDASRNSALVTGYGDLGRDIENNRVDRFVQYRDGGMRAGHYLGLQLTLADDASGTFSQLWNANSNHRGVYIIYSDFNGANAVMVFNTGTDLVVMSETPNYVSVGATNPDVDGHMNVYLVSGSIAVKNRLGSERRFQCVAFGFNEI